MSTTLRVKPLHQRSQSSPYLQHSRGFTDFKDFESGLESRIAASPAAYEASVTAPTVVSPERPRGHARALTSASLSHRPPLITTHIQVESKPASPSKLPSSSVFSSPGDISFDLSPPDSPTLTPSKEKERWSTFLPSLRPTRTNERKIERSPSPIRIADWFSGESAPVSISMLPSPTKESPDPIQAQVETFKPPVIRRKSVAPSLHSQKPKSGGSGIFSFFTKSSPTTSQLPPDLANDEFVALDVKKALQPHGPADPFSPSSFKNLQQNAEGLLARMQVAYKQQVLALKEVNAEQEAQDEELEEAQTRAHHLKNQLNDVSGRLDEREKEMQRLLEDLAEERRLRKEAERSTIRVVGDSCSPSRGRRCGRVSLGSTTSTPSMMSDTGSDPSDSSETLTEDPQDAACTYRKRDRTDTWSRANEQQYQLPVVSCKKCEERQTTPSPRAGSNLAGENASLKARVRHLEKELDGCLDLLRGIGM